MSHPHSEIALQELKHLQAPSVTKATLSFAESASLRTAFWAVSKFGGEVLIDRVIEGYKEHPILDEKGRKIDPHDLGGDAGRAFILAQDTALDTQNYVAADLVGAVRRIGRGYPLETATVQGSTDVYAVIGSLERAIETAPEKLSPSEHHFQASAQYILDHMIEQSEDDSVEYLL